VNATDAAPFFVLFQIPVLLWDLRLAAANFAIGGKFLDKSAPLNFNFFDFNFN